jgi:hypothetical protein
MNGVRHDIAIPQAACDEARAEPEHGDSDSRMDVLYQCTEDIGEQVLSCSGQGESPDQVVRTRSDMEYYCLAGQQKQSIRVS